MRARLFRCFIDGQMYFGDSDLHQCADGLMLCIAHMNGVPDEILNIKIMEYTGRQTKSLKKIFDGDILGGDPHGTAAVRWNEEYCCFECFWYEESERPDGVMEQHECTALFGTELNNCFDSWDVIGNLFEHPELLQGYSKQNNAFLRV